jgi:hypothetical protein
MSGSLQLNPALSLTYNRLYILSSRCWSSLRCC